MPALAQMRRSNRSGSLLRGSTAVLATTLFLAGAGGTETPAAGPPFRFAFSARMFAGLNENDGRAAVKVWAQIVAREHAIPVSDDVQILPSAPALADAFERDLLDGAAMTTEEFLTIEHRVPLGQLLFGVSDETITTEYLLVVRSDATCHGLADLRQTRLLQLDSPRMDLARRWLDGLLRAESLPPVPEFFASVVERPRFSATILPVFFRTAEACVINRRGFDTMVELNPELGRKLRVLAASPKLVTQVLCFRVGFDAPYRQKLVTALGEFHLSPAGRQILTVFQFDRLEEKPPSCLDSARKLMAESAADNNVPPTRLPGAPAPLSTSGMNPRLPGSIPGSTSTAAGGPRP
jgi:ABC-type phosphate/phosphonate transport system substrate-binding protein